MYHLTKILSFLLVLSFVMAFSQNQSKADSIKNEIDKGILSPSQELEAYYWLSTYTSAPDEKLKHGETLLRLARRIKNEEYEIKAYCKIGIAHRFMGNLDRALEYLFKSADAANGKQRYNVFKAELYGEISTCYTQNGDSENALYYGSQSIIMLRKTGMKQQLALSLLNHGYDYYLIGNYDSALAYYNESEPILQEIGMEIGLAYIIGNRALVFWKLGENEKAKEDLFAAIDRLQPIGDEYGMADYYNQLGKIYLEEGNEEKAFSYTLQGLSMAKAVGLKEQVSDASYTLFKLSERRGNLRDALDYQTQHYAYKDSIQNLSTTQRLGDMRTEFEVGLKQAEVDYLEEQKRNTEIIIFSGGILIIAFIVLILVVYFSFKSKNRLTKQLEKKNGELVDLNHTKDKFFSIISHDLRNPVNSMSNLVTVCKMYLRDGNASGIKEMIGHMDQSVERLVHLLDTLLNWAMQQRGHFPYVPERIHLTELMEEEVQMFKIPAESKGVKLTLESENNLTLYVDRNTTSTIFRNLISNALKFTSDSDTVHITASRDAKNKYCEVKVADSGVGIAAEKVKRLFDLNEKKSTKGTSGETGLGLGLQLVNEFVKLNKGEIEVESEEGKGTVFTVRLPLVNT